MIHLSYREKKLWRILMGSIFAGERKMIVEIHSFVQFWERQPGNDTDAYRKAISAR